MDIILVVFVWLKTVKCNKQETLTKNWTKLKAKGLYETIVNGFRRMGKKSLLVCFTPLPICFHFPFFAIIFFRHPLDFSTLQAIKTNLDGW